MNLPNCYYCGKFVNPKNHAVDCENVYGFMSIDTTRYYHFKCRNMKTKTGVELIAEERKEQIEKHGWDLKNDADYSKNELIKAALFCISPENFEWPYYWTEEFRDKILLKNRVNQLRVAGALIAAEIDRLQNEP